MNLIEKIKDRYNIITFVLIIMMLVLSLRLATLTIAQGDYYRDLSDNKRLKEVYITSPRGEIRDRYGRLLAGNKPSFTVQLLKDELNRLPKEEKNQAFLDLIRLLEEDGVNYADEIPIQLNIYKYAREEDYLKENLEPIDKVLDIIEEYDLISEILDTYYIHPTYEEHFKFITANKAISALLDRGIDVPVIASIEDGQVVFSFRSDVDIERWKKNNEVSPYAGAKDILIKYIKEDSTILRKMIDHSIARKLVYDILVEKGLSANIVIQYIAIEYKEDYLKQKRALSRIYPEVTMTSSAKDDFINIVKKVSLKNFLETTIEDSEGNKIIPGKVFLSMVQEKGIEVPIEIELDESSSSVIYRYTGSKELGGDDNLVDLLISYGVEADIIADFITDEDIKYLVQAQLLKDGVNPRISIAKEFQYVDMNNLITFYTANRIPDNSTDEEAFKILRENYDIDESLSDFEARKMLILHNQLKKQGYLAYTPINIAYGIKDSTVAKIEESLADIPGIKVSVEPVRYYPEGTTAAHILGYLGKISQPNEIEKYIEELNYSPNDLIGKTGIEESFEQTLRGKNGVRKVEVDSLGNTTNVLEEVKPIPGDNIYLTIDLKLQQVAEQALKQTLEAISTGGTYRSPWGDYSYGINRRKGRPYIANTGAVVAIDVKTGEVLASASYPAYDPNLFATGISNTDWESLFPENPNDQMAPRPLYNIVTQTAIQPGSVYKMVTALTALEKGLSPNYKIQDMGRVDIGNRQFRCLIWTNTGGTHGFVNVYEALRDSCNYYFYTLAMGYNQKSGVNIGVQISIEDIAEMSKKLGLNDKTGIEINIPAEVSGGVPDPQRKVINTKASLKSYLNRNIDTYFKEDFEYDDEYRKETIDEIVSWIDLEEPLSREEVIRRLDALGLKAEEKLPNEREGLADRIKYTYINFAGWNITDTLNVTIGQGTNAYTPIQMANYIGIIANGGYRHKLTLIDSIRNYNNSETKYVHQPNPERIDLNDYENLEHIKKGMKMVAESGTARRVFQNFPVEVGVKTGTAQRAGKNPATGDTYDDFAWFVGFAPYEDPEIAVAAVIFQGGTGGYAGPMVRDIMAEYLGLNDSNIYDGLPYDNFITK